MRLIILTVVIFAVCASAANLQPFGYHQDVGIPLATRIKDNEDRMMVKAGQFNEERIIGGVWAPAGGHPFFVGLLIDLLTRPGQSVCGSSLLTVNRLLTAAHCWDDGRDQAWRFTAVLGSTQLHWGGQRIQSSHVIMHPQYQNWNLYADVAMVYMPFDAVLSVGSVELIAIPTSNDAWNTFAGETANAVGFGATSDSQQAASTILSHVNLQVISNQQCFNIVPTWVDFLTEGTLCTSGFGFVGTCGGDSGGPLVVQRNQQPLLIGVASFAAQGACEGGWPSGFARVTNFLNFINQHLW